ncbi:hypothetical protein BS50DRAFT_100615 [Corynespora cassiicola Philippines]|uniref:Uncharacterized protein n=1 Tax=Corynespora cassiicola Philippines TaxID=1448308 RepID=A0A2T2NBY4_CORCC|nr:hypothetical protein BS50DRAFT_100615 [Corynespora cassiicola Philippines]
MALLHASWSKDKSRPIRRLSRSCCRPPCRGISGRCIWWTTHQFELYLLPWRSWLGELPAGSVLLPFFLFSECRQAFFGPGLREWIVFLEFFFHPKSIIRLCILADMAIFEQWWFGVSGLSFFFLFSLFLLSDLGMEGKGSSETGLSDQKERKCHGHGGHMDMWDWVKGRVWVGICS